MALPPELNAAGDAAVVVVIPKSAPQDAETSELVHRIRDDIVPTSLEGTGADAAVGGLTAVFIDLSDRVAGNLPMFIAAIVGLSFVLLMIVFRSILVPLKAALMNLLSIGAAYGVVVAVFQWGWGKQLVGLEHTVPIVSFIPMFMFAILFGLSMDYEVFLLSRVREEYLAGRGNTESVVEGISSTARVITSAALIMIAVFFGFVLGDDPIVKMMGLGLATAVFVDATLVRVILVPASMKLLGDANWWLPGWLDRILPKLDIEGEAGLPEPEYRVAHPVFGDPAVPVAGRHRARDREGPPRRLSRSGRARWRGLRVWWPGRRSGGSGPALAHPPGRRRSRWPSGPATAWRRVGGRRRSHVRPGRGALRVAAPGSRPSPARIAW